jgi:hypothetical protein
MADRCAVEAEARRCAIAERDGVPFNARVAPATQTLDNAVWLMGRTGSTVYSILAVRPDGSISDPNEVMSSPNAWRGRVHAEQRAREYADGIGVPFIVIHTIGRVSQAHCHVAIRSDDPLG